MVLGLEYTGSHLTKCGIGPLQFPGLSILKIFIIFQRLLLERALPEGILGTGREVQLQNHGRL